MGSPEYWNNIIRGIAEASEINFRYFETDHITISLDEKTTLKEVVKIVQVFANARSKEIPEKIIREAMGKAILDFPDKLIRKSEYLTHPVFNSYHSEHELLRYLKRLENKDLSLVHSMISLGSCTMKLNATTEMLPITWPELANLHPFVPINQAEGFQEMA